MKQQRNIKYSTFNMCPECLHIRLYKTYWTKSEGEEENEAVSENQAIFRLHSAAGIVTVVHRPAAL
jgi:hypothetical protein